MKIYLETNDATAAKHSQESRLIDGVMLSNGSADQIVDPIAELKLSNIIVPVLDSLQNMVDEGIQLFTKHKEVVTVSLPMTFVGLAAVRSLNQHGINTNVDLVFNAAQALIAAKSGANSVSIPVGLIDDQGYAGLEVVRSVTQLLMMQGFDTEVIARDLRTPHRSVRSLFNGAGTVCMEPSVFWQHYNHVLTDTMLT